MSKHDKLIKKLKTKPKDFTYNELKTLLIGLGYEELSKGKTSGSRVVFLHQKTKHLIRLHKPHPKNILKMYQISLILDELSNTGEITWKM